MNFELTGELFRPCVGAAVNTIVYCLFDESSPADAEPAAVESCSGTGSTTGVAAEEAPEAEVEGLGHSRMAQASKSKSFVKSHEQHHEKEDMFAGKLGKGRS